MASFFLTIDFIQNRKIFCLVQANNGAANYLFNNIINMLGFEKQKIKSNKKDKNWEHVIIWKEKREFQYNFQNLYRQIFV